MITSSYFQSENMLTHSLILRYMHCPTNCKICVSMNCFSSAIFFSNGTLKCLAYMITLQSDVIINFVWKITLILEEHGTIDIISVIFANKLADIVIFKCFSTSIRYSLTNMTTTISLVPYFQYQHAPG